MAKKLTPGQELAVLLCASVDAKLTPIQRAGAREVAETIGESKSPTVPGLLRGPFLTDEGRAWVAARLPPSPGPTLFPRVVDDLLRRLRGSGRPVADVRLEPEAGAESTWTLRWTGEGFADFALVGQGRRPEAMESRCELARSAVALGLEVVADGPTWAKFAPVAPVAESEGEEDDGDEEDSDSVRPWRGEYLRAAREEAEEEGDRTTTLDRLLGAFSAPPRRGATLEEIVAGLEGVAYVPRADDAPLSVALGAPPFTF